jgi:hypothetical protein
MTREEQIIEAGTYHLCGIRPPKTHGHNMHELAYISRNLVFEAGAKWADENPKPGIVNKQEFIDKACAWLKDTMYYLDCGDYNRLTHAADTVEEMIEDFCKAMEE